MALVLASNSLAEVKYEEPSADSTGEPEAFKEG
jgi:hypothetical protein